MNIDTNNMINISDVSRNPSKYINEAEKGRTWLVLRNGTAAAVVTAPTNIDRLQKLDNIEEDLRLVAAALTRMATDTGVRHRLADVAAEFGVDLDDGED
jgi:antitoxin (DNA-binding transcriptional repressor) of toxin-antitoxin stability system